MIMTGELLNCPFCGAKPEDHRGDVSCSNRDCPVSECWFTPEEWNLRTDRERDEHAKAVASAEADAKAQEYPR